jgi:pyruvate dehydrogenase E1 component beta subunit
MTDGQVSLPLVIKSGNGGGARFGAQHSQAVENWAMAIPGLKVVAPAFPADVKGLMAASIRDNDPVLFFESKSLYAVKGEVPDGEHIVPLGKANVIRQGSDVTIVALALMVPRALKAADVLKEQHGINATVIDLRSLVPLDTQTILSEVAKTGRLVTVEENPRLCGWGAEISSIVSEELFWDLDGPVVRVTTPHIPLSAANNLEDIQLPSPERIVASVRQLCD